MSMLIHAQIYRSTCLLHNLAAVLDRMHTSLPLYITHPHTSTLAREQIARSPTTSPFMAIQPVPHTFCTRPLYISMRRLRLSTRSHG